MRRAAVLLPLGGVLLLAPAPAAAQEARFRPCPDVGPGARCARVAVPLDRSGRVPGRIRLRVVRLGARRKTDRAVLYLSGGPGGAGIEEFTLAVGDVLSLRSRYDLAGFDQRGTGASGLLRCPEIERDDRLRSTEAGARCAARLGARRGLYTTRASVEDVEAVRIALGAEKLLIYGVSYGTKLAIAYARAHPDRVERMILDSVLDPDGRDPFSLDSFRAMGPSLAALCPASCRGVSANPAGDLRALVQALGAAPLRAVVGEGRGRRVRRTLTGLDISDLLFDSDYDPRLRAPLPAAARSALAGDAAPLLRLAALAEPLGKLPGPRSFSSARYATVCEEVPLPWARGTPFDQRLGAAESLAASLGPDAFAPFDFRTIRADEIDLCLRWPETAEDTSLPAGPNPDVPALLLQGEEDLRTPMAASARVAAGFRRATRVTVPGVAHAVLAADPSGCGRRALRSWLRGRAVKPRCARVRTEVPPVDVLPRRLEDLKPARGVSGTAGRTVRALDVTLDYLVLELNLTGRVAGAGLRGGSYRLGPRGLRLSSVEVVPGVRVSGRALQGGALRLRVRGTAAADGTVELGRDGSLRGRLGGKRVRTRLRGGPPTARATGAATATASRHTLVRPR